MGVVGADELKRRPGVLFVSVWCGVVWCGVVGRTCVVAVGPGQRTLLNGLGTPSAKNQETCILVLVGGNFGSVCTDTLSSRVSGALVTTKGVRALSTP